MAYSTDARKEISKVNADDLPVTLLEIDHSELVTPIRVINDRQDVVFETNTYIALGFDISLPDDLSKGNTRAALSIDNVGKELVQWLEDSNGGAGTTVRIVQILRSDPSTIEYDVTMGLINIAITAARITGDLGFDDLLNVPGVTLLYTARSAPGLF